MVKKNIWVTFSDMQANLLTGLVNLSMDTLFVSPATALVVLIGYGFIICATAAFADYNDIKLKFW